MLISIPVAAVIYGLIRENKKKKAMQQNMQEAFGWKKTTTYTVLKRLCEKGIFQTVKGTVTSLMSRQEFYSVRSENFVKETFDGSLPAFFAAFTARKSLTPEEIAELRNMIDSYGEGK